ncbi:hypothetical protein [Lentibacillus sp. CBA3610]|uniref:hypothetical protein n=1 Tax=Lentibacillus sp. CBA3610 TaxID=2518176 RepID=UPI0020D22E03|nr:hypothetical protein [Lentibacillus sp. CBA3610]
MKPWRNYHITTPSMTPLALEPDELRNIRTYMIRELLKRGGFEMAVLAASNWGDLLILMDRVIHVSIRSIAIMLEAGNTKNEEGNVERLFTCIMSWRRNWCWQYGFSVLIPSLLR